MASTYKESLRAKHVQFFGKRAGDFHVPLILKDFWKGEYVSEILSHNLHYAKVISSHVQHSISYLFHVFCAIVRYKSSFSCTRFVRMRIKWYRNLLAIWLWHYMGGGEGGGGSEGYNLCQKSMWNRLSRSVVWVWLSFQPVSQTGEVGRRRRSATLE